MKIQCPVCNREVEITNPNGVATIDCLHCGRFQTENFNTFNTEVLGWSPEQQINLSGWIRENPNFKFSDSNLKNLATLRNLTVGEKADKILLHLAQKFPKPGEIHELSGGAHLEFLAIGRLTDTNELVFFLRDYLYAELGFLLRHELVTELGDDSRYSISPKGWAYIETLRHGSSDSHIGFIAMWFSESVNDAWLALEQGIRDAGYEPLRIDQKVHNNKIDDEIVAAIRRSKFVVADFTGHRGGVYFEAGLAMGLGLSVIWLCRNDDLKDLHFDTRQYNHIAWKADELDKLSKALQNRIEATIGRGPLLPAMR